MVMLIQFLGLIAFSRIMNSVLEYEKIGSVHEAIARRKNSTKEFLEKIDETFTNNEMSDELYDVVFNSIDT